MCWEERYETFSFPFDDLVQETLPLFTIHETRAECVFITFFQVPGILSGGGTLTIQREKAPALFFPLESNTFSLISFEKGMHPFVQYINHLAGKESFLLVEGIVS